MATDAKAEKPARPAARKTSASGGCRTATAASSTPADEKALEAILAALTAARDGDFSVRLPARRRDVIGDVQAPRQRAGRDERADGQGARSGSRASSAATAG